MPWIIDYEIVLQQMTQRGFRCNYYNSGAFGFANETAVSVRGWIGAQDPTIKPAIQPLTRSVAPPYEETLAEGATRAWQGLFPGRVWIMPLSHWHYELQFGSRDWMPALLENIGLDAGLLMERANAAAIEFSATETKQFTHLVLRLLQNLISSDFLIAFTSAPAICTLHHHKQLWWVTSDEAAIAGIETIGENLKDL